MRDDPFKAIERVTPDYIEHSPQTLRAGGGGRWMPGAGKALSPAQARFTLNRKLSREKHPQKRR